MTRGQSRRHRHRQCSQPTRAQRKPPSCEPATLRGEAHEASAHRETICFSHTAAAQAAPSGLEGHSEGAFASGEGESPRRHVLTRRLRNRDWGRIAQWRPNPAQHRLTRTSRSVNLPGPAAQTVSTSLLRRTAPREHRTGCLAAAVLRVSSPLHLLGWPRGRYRPRGQHRQTSPSVSAPVRVLAFVFAAEMRIPLSGTPEGAALIG